MNVGLYNRWLDTLGGGERHSLAIADYLSCDHDVSVLSPVVVNRELAAERLGLDLSRVHFPKLDQQSPAQLTAVSAAYDLFINASHWDFFHSQAPLSAMLVFFPLQPAGRGGRVRYQVGRALTGNALGPLIKPVTARLSPGLDTRLENLISPGFLDSVATYDLLWANSSFTQEWIQRYWGRESELLYPPVDVEAFQPAVKEQRILSVGRFFASSHNKKHEIMLRTFRQMVDEGLIDWELHLVGGTRPESIHQQYLDGLRSLIEGYPITIHTDIPRAELVRFYESSAIYWHAAGFGEDEQQTPHALEHFGITTVEAMAAGCVPVVYGSGGQTELVEPERTGFLWYTTADLAGYTRRLMADEELRTQMANHAAQSSHRFDQAHFEDAFAGFVGDNWFVVHAIAR